MSDFVVTKTRILAGIWEGVVQSSPGNGGQDPQIDVIHLDEPVRSFSLAADPTEPDRWLLRIAIPPDRLSDGVQVFAIRDAQTCETLDSFTILTGEPLEDDIRAEVELLRAELDMLKKAFRRHCLEG